jgi:hypothetical protein
MKTILIALWSVILMSIIVPSATAQTPSTPADLRRLADDYYRWRNEKFPGVVE